MATLFINSNLFDSIINEVEKISHYEQIFSKISADDMKLVESENYDYDLMGFLYCNNQSILTDKLLRSFIDLDHAIKRNYKESIKHAHHSHYVTYVPELMSDVNRVVDNIVIIFQNKKLYSDDYMGAKSFAAHFLEVEKMLQDNSQHKLHNKKDITGFEYLTEIEIIYEKIRKLMLLLKCELESKPYLKQASYILKYVITLCLTLSIAHSVVMFE